MIKDQNLNLAYRTIERKILNSESYQNFLYEMTNNEDIYNQLNDMFTFPDKKDLNIFVKFTENLEQMQTLTSLLNINDEFNRAIRNAVINEDAIDYVVYMHFIETKFGNNDKEDLNFIDALFPILESIFGLDSLIKGVSNKKALLERFNQVTGDFTGLEAKDFTDYFRTLFNDVKDLKTYDEIINVIRLNRNTLTPYISVGNNLIINEITKDNNKSFETYDTMMKNVLDIIGNGKNNVK